MKIRTKILSMTVSLIVVTIVVIVAIVVHSIRKKGAEEIRQYRESEHQRVRQELKDYVELAYGVVERNYQTTQGSEYIEENYGRHLKNMVDLVHGTVNANYLAAQDKRHIEKFYGQRLKDVIDVAFFMLQEQDKRAKAGEITVEQAKRNAAESIRNFRFNNAGYLWINDTTLPLPKMIMHPMVPELEGKILDDPKFNCALGSKKNLFQAATETCLDQGEGFVDYLWPKPGPDGASKEDVPKLSYVRLFKPWNWVLGVGIYVDEAVGDAKATSLETIRSMRYDHGNGYFWVNDSQLPYPEMIMHPLMPDLEGRILNDPQYDCASGKKQNIFQAMVETCRKQDSGFVQYNWPKTDEKGVSTEEPKISYVRLFAPWQWVIGTGIFVDDAERLAKAQSLDEIRKMRYGNDEGYFWVNSDDLPYPVMLAHPILPELEGKRLDDPKFNCALGKNENLFAAMAKTCRETSGGYVDYTWPKPAKDGTVTGDKPKLSYVKIFKPWNWVIGTGVYVDNIEDNIRQTEASLQNQVNLIVLKILLCAALILASAILFCFITANTLAAPVAQLVATMRNIDLDSLSTTEIQLRGSQEIRELALIFNTMLKSIHDSVIRLKETTTAKERIESELNIARSIQMSIIPKLFPAFPHRPEFDVYGSIVTAKAVGGDLYDFFFMDDDHLCFAIGDVSGKGVPASLFMAVTRTLMRAKTVKGQTAGEIATLMNQILCQDNDMSMFVTFFLCVFEISTGKLDCCNAGHNPPFILRRMQTIDRLGKVHGPPLGVFGESPYASEAVILEPGDTIFLYTDGVTEATNIDHELFDEARLLAALEECKMQSPKGITDIILAKVTAFAGGAEQADDITILALNYRGNIKKA